ncbi:hypothetical protein JIX56_30155 [Streptomyces sp. CA-210063]|uniref:hypothetical protein n=1 Tax=Streptomyces sp. CA-210063 TaxID=2801029 RepID=UPI00214BE13D|nr:hypothetical protein [Streptomyces sp. CA-210063]UUU33768.1 hypothetical protein JIX56_30155 [Streptomyces sp. CA-210063]
MALVLAVLTTAGLLTLAGPAGSAEAAAPGCGGRKVRTLTFDAGTIKVYRKGTRYVCAVLVPKKTGTNKARKASVEIRPWAGRWAKNKKRPTGPVTVHAGKRGVWIKARVGSLTYNSGWILR